MTRSVRVTIAGRDYILRGEDEEKILRSAREVDGQWQQLQAHVSEHSTTTMAILVALNLADQYHELRTQSDVDTRYVRDSIERMLSYIEACLAAPGVSGQRPDIAL